MIRDRLRRLYGDDLGSRTAVRLERHLEAWRARLPARPPRLFDERDMLLITYADTFTTPGEIPLRTLHSFAARHLRPLISGLHMLPFFPWSSDYGFSIIDYLAVDPRLGSWPDVTALGRDFDLMVDFVCNHLSAESEWFARFKAGLEPERRFFRTAAPDADLAAVTRPRTTPLLTPVDTADGRRWVWTTFSADQVDLDYREPDLLLRMVDVLLTYVERGASVLRLDAVGYLWKEVGTSSIHLPQTHELVKLFREVLDETAPGVALVTETNVPHADNVRYFGDGHDEAQMVYQFPLAPLVLDAFRRGDASRLRVWAAGLRTPSPSTTFFNFLASHDGIGVVPAKGLLPAADVAALAEQVRRHGGEVSAKADADGSESPYELNTTFFDALSDPRDTAEAWPRKRDRFLCAQAIMLALAGVPGIYVHSLFGSHNDIETYRRTGWKRDLNHGHLPVAELEARLAEPASAPAQVLAGLERLLRARRGHPAFHPGAPQALPAAPPGVLAILRGPVAGRGVLALHNLTAQARTIPLATLAPGARAGRALLGGAPDLPLAPLAVNWIELDWT